MLSPSVSADISKYKSQLDDFLSKKYVDQSLLLGFTAVVQSKFSQWIIDDVAVYHKEIHASSETPQGQETAEFDLIQLLEQLWAKFLHPIVKFYQRQHADLYFQSVDSLKDKKKGTFKIVEMRKLNETFTKFVKTASTGYGSILQHMMSTYENALIPKRYLADLGFESGQNLVKSTHLDFKANLTFVLYHCLLGLGNLSRHAANFTVTYVNPCKSVASYYKHLKLQQDANNKALQSYQPALEYYYKCIGLLPALNEPYNHIGVIFNSVNSKFEAALWFLRSQFTRIPNYVVGKVNLATIFKKPWLDAAFANVKLKKAKDLTEYDVNIWLLRIVAQFFFSSFYKRPYNSEAAQKEFIGVLFSNPETSNFVQSPNIILNHLIVLICFFCWADAEDYQSGKKKLGYFFVSYLNSYFRDVAEINCNRDIHLPNLRFILAFLRKQTALLTFDKGDLNHSLAKAVNAIILNDQEKQSHRMAILSDAYVAQDLPTRTHYFAEDVAFKDFGPIGYQFKDFQDSRLFASDNVGPLFGGEFFPKAQNIPLFLDNFAVQQIEKEFELNSEKLDSERKKNLKNDLVAQASESLENDMRFCAIAKQVSNNFDDIAFDEMSHLLQVKVQVSATPVIKNGRKSSPASKKQNKNDKKQSDEKRKRDYASVIREGPTKQKAKELPKPPVPPKAATDDQVQVANLSTDYSTSNVAPSSLEEIELIIAGHAQSFRQQSAAGSKSINTEAGLSDMVNSLINDTYQEKSSEHVVIPDSQESLGGLKTQIPDIQASSTQQNQTLSQQITATHESPQVQGQGFQMPQAMNMTPQMPISQFAYGSMMHQNQFLQGPPQPFGYPQGYGMPMHSAMAPPPFSQGQPDFQQYANIYGQPGYNMYGDTQGPWVRPGQVPWNYYGGPSSQTSQNFGSSQ